MSETSAAGTSLITLDPGHFHAALVQKSMLPGVDETVRVYAPEGPDAEAHLARIEAFNRRADNPTSWVEKVYVGPDYLERMLAEKKGGVVVIAGDNARKAEYILKSVEAGLNVLADKPMAIVPEDYPVLERAFAAARKNGTLLYDIMTERFEIATLLQRELSRIPEVFGELLRGTAEEPAITKESVHHFRKLVSGKPLLRPAWFFDAARQGEGIVDVTTHLVDLVQWEAFPDQALSPRDVEIVGARRWPTELTADRFALVTGMGAFPPELLGAVEDGALRVFSNGEIRWRLRGVHARASVVWNFEAPPGGGDTHLSVMRGGRCDLLIRQGAEEGYRPALYVRPNGTGAEDAFGAGLEAAVSRRLAPRYPGVLPRRLERGLWTIDIPERYRVGHEAHFAQVAEGFLGFLREKRLPGWEVPNMLAKYWTTTEALRAARRGTPS